MSGRTASLEAHATFPNGLQHLHAMHQFVRQHAIEAGFSNVALGDIELAVVEACANIVKHAYRNVAEQTRTVEIGVSFGWGALTVVMTDWGTPWSPPAGPVPRPDPSAMIASGRRGGMGIFFMQQMMDEVAWESRPGDCNRLRMVKRLA